MKVKSVIIIFIFTLYLSLSCSNQKMWLDKPLDASTMATEYISNIDKGNKKYKGEFITVFGEVWQSYSNKYNEKVIILMTPEKKYGIKCTLSPNIKPPEKPLKQGEILKINGKCMGYEDYVILNGCIILKN